MKQGKYVCLHDSDCIVEVIGDCLVWHTVIASEKWVLYKDLRPSKKHLPPSSRKPAEFRRMFKAVE
jgi:hypothetical protein